MGVAVAPGLAPSLVGHLYCFATETQEMIFFLRVLLALVKRGGLKEYNTNEGKMEERKGTIAPAFCY